MTQPWWQTWQFWATCAGMLALTVAACVVVLVQTADALNRYRKMYDEEREAFFKWRFPAAARQTMEGK